MDDRKKVGCCTVCDAECFEVASRYTEGPYRGEIKGVGRPLDARRLTIIRASGRLSNWTLCADCQVTPGMMKTLHRKEIGAMRKEGEVGKRAPAQEEAREKMLNLFVWDIPLGVLCEQNWLEVT